MPEGEPCFSAGERIVIDPDGLHALLGLLRADGRRVLGPSVRDGAIVYGEIDRIDMLPRGWTEEQEAGRYRLRRRDDQALFGYAVGPHSPRQLLFAPRQRLFQIRRKGRSFERVDIEPPPEPLALIGARACDLAGIEVLDRVLAGPVGDPEYARRRAQLFLIAVQCGVAGGSCFCVSMGTGPRARAGFDLALTEILSPKHRFVVEIGSQAGADVASRLGAPQATAEDVRAAEEIVAETAQRMGRRLDTDGIRELLYRNQDHPRWDEVASRCLSCTSCTLVCPTCFCSTVEDTTDLSGEIAERWRRWDSCFTLDHSYVHGGSVRASLRSRYRQWLTHKLASWIDQFGTSGCVGCGRCISWCPASIDITSEVAAIRAADGEVIHG